uniref:Uncharacterized protein n=1 Tax=Triticum urartu TaxID=4572 RepID=A0A8R7UPZ5_TRIUA
MRHSSSTKCNDNCDQSTREIVQCSHNSDMWKPKSRAVLVVGQLGEHPLDPPQLRQRLPGVGPVVLVRRHAPERQLRHRLHAGHHAGELVQHRRVHHLPQLADLDLGHHPVRQRHVPPLPAHVHGPQPRHQLQHHHAEAVHVALLRQLERPVVVRVQVPRRALRRRAAHHLPPGRRGAGVGRRQEPRQPEVAEPGAHVRLHEDVGGGDVAVDHVRLDREVEVLERRRDLGRHGEPGPPGERRRRCGRGAAAPAVEVVREGAVGDEVVDEEQRARVGAEAVEADEVRVAERGEDEHLVAEGLGDGGGGRGRGGRHVEPLHRGGAARGREVRQVHRPEAAVPELARGVEPGRGGAELLVGEGRAAVVQAVAAEERGRAGGLRRLLPRRAPVPLAAYAAHGDGDAEVEQEHGEERRGGNERGGEHAARAPGAAAALGAVLVGARVRGRRGLVVAEPGRGRRREG